MLTAAKRKKERKNGERGEGRKEGKKERRKKEGKNMSISKRFTKYIIVLVQLAVYF